MFYHDIITSEPWPVPDGPYGWEEEHMAATSNIEWTEATWNPVTGCDKVSPGCAHCYAETFA